MEECLWVGDHDGWTGPCVAEQRWRALQGQLYDAATDHVYLSNRFYDPSLGRFMSMDPKGMVDGPNMYNYAGGDPVNRWDPMGTDYWVVNAQGTALAGPFEISDAGKAAAKQAAQELRKVGYAPYNSARVKFFLPEDENTPAAETRHAEAEAIFEELLNPKALLDRFYTATNTTAHGFKLGDIGARVSRAHENRLRTPFEGIFILLGAALGKIGEVLEPYEEPLINIEQAVRNSVPPGYNGVMLIPAGARVFIRASIVAGKIVSATKVVFNAAGRARFLRQVKISGRSAARFIYNNVYFEGRAMSLPNVRFGAQARAARGAVNDAIEQGALSIRRVPSRGPIHHIASDKDSVYKPLFEELFEHAGMTMQDKWNRMRISGHVGPHGRFANEYILRRLQFAVRGQSGQAYREALIRELKQIRREIRNGDLGDLFKAAASRQDVRGDF